MSTTVHANPRPGDRSLRAPLVTLGWMPGKLRANARSLTEGVFYRGRNGVYLTLARWIKDP